MNRMYRNISLICLVLSLCSCGKRASVLPVVDVPAEFDSVIEIKKWLAIGPFEFDTLTISPTETFLINDLSQYGIDEGRIDVAGVGKLQEQGAKMFLIDQKTVKIRTFNYLRDSVENKSNVYLAAWVHSATTQDVALIIDGAYSYAGWLNGEKLIESRRKYNTSKVGDKFIRVTLKEGENILFFKVNRGTNLKAWDLCCAIASLHEAERIFHDNYMGCFVDNAIVNDTIKIYAGHYLNGKVEVVDSDDQIVIGGSFDNQNTNENPFVICSLDGLHDGFYQTILTVNGKKMEQMIYKGDYDTFSEQTKDTVDRINGSNSHIDDMKAVIRALSYLKERYMDSFSSPSDLRYFSRNMAFWGYSLYRMLQNDTTTTQIMTYRDEDDNLKEFIFYTGNRQRQGVPLVIVTPYALSGDFLLEDWYMSNLDYMEPDMALAGQYGFALALIYAEGKNHTAEKTENEIIAVIRRLELEHRIDRKKIFLFGECEGGRRALIQLMRSPERYAACALSSPVTLTGSNDGVPINLIPFMGNTPIMIRHGINDEVVSVENSRKFVAEAKKYGLPVEYLETTDSHIFLHKDNRRFAFEFFSRQ